MNLFEHIIVPVDFSDCSKNALQQAYALTQQYDGRLSAVYALNIVTTPAGSMDEAKAAVEKQLNELYDSLGISCTSIIRKGIPAEEIVETINSDAFSMCIMGTHKRHDIISELAGTVALKVMKHTHKPLLIIPGHISLKRVEKVAFATDFKRLKDLDILDYIREITLAWKAELHLVNVNEHPEQLEEKDAEEALQLHQYLFDVNHAFFFAKEKNPVEGINHYVKNNNIDLLILIPRKHSFYSTIIKDSTSEQIALTLDVPLFSLHE